MVPYPSAYEAKEELHILTGSLLGYASGGEYAGDISRAECQFRNCVYRIKNVPDGYS